MTYFLDDRIAVDLSAIADCAGSVPDGLDPASIEEHVRTCRHCAALVRGTGDDASGPPERVWNSIEETLRREGLI